MLSFIKDRDDIPLLLETNSDYVISCPVNRLVIDNAAGFLGNIDESITIIGKIDRVYNNNEKIEVYDIGKEVLKINRTIRRAMTKEVLEKMIVLEESPLVKIIPIIIYK